MPNSAVSKPGLLVGLVIVLAIAVGVYAVVSHDFSGAGGNHLKPEYQYDLSNIMKTDPAQVLYRETGAITLTFKEARAVGVGLMDQIIVAGDRAVVVFEANGTKLREISLTDEPWAVAVGGGNHDFAGRIYMALKTRVKVFGPETKKPAVWANLGPEALLTSIAVAEHEVLVADAGRHAVVHRFDSSGKLLGRIDGHDRAVAES